MLAGWYLWFVTTPLPAQAGAPIKPVERYVVQEGGAVIMLPGNLSQAALKEVMQPYSNYQVGLMHLLILVDLVTRVRARR